MEHPTPSHLETIGISGETLYRERLQALVETPENWGKRISIDIESGDYEIDPSPVVAALRLRSRRPHGTLYGRSIGSDTVYAFGASLPKTKQ